MNATRNGHLNVRLNVSKFFNLGRDAAMDARKLLSMRSGCTYAASKNDGK
jgi:hypothetical protein